MHDITNCSNFITLRQSRPFPDPLVKVYDIRTMTPLPPIAFSAGPAFIHAIPTRASSLVVVSNQGLINVVDASNSASNEFYQVSSISVSVDFPFTSLFPSSIFQHTLLQALYLWMLHIWPSEMLMEQFIYCLKQTIARHLTDLKDSRFLGLTRRVRYRK